MKKILLIIIPALIFATLWITNFHHFRDYMIQFYHTKIFPSGLKNPLFGQKLVCSKYQYEICTKKEIHTDTCYKTCEKTVTDCDKCGETTKWKDVGTRSGGVCAEWECDYDRCTVVVYDGDEECTIGKAQFGQAYYRGDTWGGPDSWACKNCEKTGKGCYYCMGKWKKVTECKTCKIKYKCDPYPCNEREVCVQWEVRTGPTPPKDARNVQCIEQYETCGNGLCEPEFDENNETCPADCGEPIVCEKRTVYAKDPVTNECRKFESPCDVPEGWIEVESCTTGECPDIRPAKPCEEAIWQDYPVCAWDVGPCLQSNPIVIVSVAMMLLILGGLLIIKFGG